MYVKTDPENLKECVTEIKHIVHNVITRPNLIGFGIRENLDIILLAFSSYLETLEDRINSQDNYIKMLEDRINSLENRGI